MKTNDAEMLIDYLQTMGYEAKMYEDYSGRCMYGETTDGVVTDAHPDEIKGHAREAGVKDGFRSDNLGLSYIYY